MADLTQGFLLTVRRAGLQVTRHARGQLAPSDIDIKCVNRSGGTLTGAVAGSDVVTLKVDEIVAGGLPPITTFASNTTFDGVLGVVHWDEGSVADDKECWVRVVGIHPYAKVFGPNVAVGDLLGYSSGMTAGELRRVTTFASGGAVALAAQSTSAQVATAALLLNRYGLQLN